MFKVKAWDKELKQMFEVKQLDFSDWWVQCVKPTDAPKENGGAFYGERNSFKNEETDRHILLYSTGVKDINKKESYLGDTVKYGDSTGVITFKDGCYEIDWIINKDFFTERLGVFKEVFEIIGNKFENADLIKKEV